MNKVDRFEDTPGSAIARNCAAWGIPHHWAIALFAAPFVPLPGAIFLAVTEHPWLYALTVEDGLLEWLQVATLLAVCAAYLTVAYRMGRAGGRFLALLPALAAIAALLVAGEEISWGQRLFGFSTPAALEAINTQDETNLHNIGAFEFATRVGQFLASGYGTLLPLLALRARISPGLLGSYVVPPVALVPYFLLPFAYWSARIPVDPGLAMYAFSEFTELSFYTGLALLGLLSLRRLAAVQLARPARNAAAARPSG